MATTVPEVVHDLRARYEELLDIAQHCAEAYHVLSNSPSNEGQSSTAYSAALQQSIEYLHGHLAHAAHTLRTGTDHIQNQMTQLQQRQSQINAYVHTIHQVGGPFFLIKCGVERPLTLHRL